MFLHISRPVYDEHAYNFRVHSFYYLKWRHLANRLPLDTATLKLQHYGVGRRLAHKKDERLCLQNREQDQQSIGPNSDEKVFLVEGYCVRARCGHYKWT